MPDNPAVIFYKCLRFCTRVITRFTSCSKILIYRVKNNRVSWKRSLRNTLWNQGPQCDGMVHLQGAIVGHPCTAIHIRQDYNSFQPGYKLGEFLFGIIIRFSYKYAQKLHSTKHIEMRHRGYLLRSLSIRVLESGVGLGGITIREFFPFTAFVTTGNAIFLTRHLHDEVCSYTLSLGLYFAKGLSSAKAIPSHRPYLQVNLSHFEL